MKNILWLIVSLEAATLASAGTPPLPVINTNLIFDVTNTVFAGGAFGNGVSNSAAAIQAAIDSATTNIAGGVRGAIVRLPAGGTLSTYLSGPLTLKNNVNLQIDAGATLKMLPYTNWPGTTTFIMGSSARNVAISGSGTIDGNAAFSTGGVTNNWWQSGGSSSQISRPNFIQFSSSSTVLVETVTLQNSPTFHIMVKNNNFGLTIRNITIKTAANSPNTDGIDLASTNVLIYGCSISGGDDNIQIGGSSALASDITITNCTFGTGHGLSIGSPTQSGINNLIVSNCVWNGTEHGIKIKTDRGIGGVIENLKYLDLTMNNINFAIEFYTYYNSVGTPSTSFSVTPFRASTDTVHTVTGTTPIIRNITISNLTATTLGGNIAGIIWGLPEMLVSNVTLSKVNISAPTKTFCVYNARGIKILDSNLTAPNTTTNTLTIYNAGIVLSNTVANTNLVTLGGLAKPPTNNVLSFFNGRAAITDTNMLGTGPITLVGSSLTFNQASVNSFNSNISVLDGSTLIFTGGVNVINGTLSGNGFIRGSVTIDGTLAPDGSPGTLTISNNLVVSSGAALQYDLGTTSDLTAVSNNLTLGGTLNVTDAAGFTNTTYTLFTYGGILTYNGLTIGSVPAGFDYVIETGTVGQVNLIVSLPLSAFEQWQIQYFGSTDDPAAEPSADPDGDGLSNQSEFLAGTDPTDSASALRVIATEKQGSDVVITWTTAGGKTNIVQVTAGGGSGGYSTNFTDLSGLIIISGSGNQTTNYTDNGGATNVPARYYRVRWSP